MVQRPRSGAVAPQEAASVLKGSSLCTKLPAAHRPSLPLSTEGTASPAPSQAPLPPPPSLPLSRPIYFSHARCGFSQRHGAGSRAKQCNVRCAAAYRQEQAGSWTPRI